LSTPVRISLCSILSATPNEYSLLIILLSFALDGLACLLQSTSEGKSKRGKVAKAGSLLQELRGYVSSLQELCVKFVIKNIDCVEDFGGNSEQLFIFVPRMQERQAMHLLDYTAAQSAEYRYIRRSQNSDSNHDLQTA
jgi:hypothetical protein